MGVASHYEDVEPPFHTRVYHNSGDWVSRGHGGRHI